MRPVHFICVAAGAAFAAFQTGIANAALTPRDAHAAAQKWLAAHPRPFGRTPGRPAGEVMTAAENGTNLFHAVNLSGGGFAVFAASGNGAAPMAFAASGTFSETNAAPLWSMLLSDSGVRGARGRRGSSRLVAGTFLPEGVTVFRTAVAAAPRLLSAHVADASGLDDLRVPPLVQSKWDQGDGIYNRYTPYNSVCGCVATAMAQIMRFHEWPAGEVPMRTKACSYKLVATNLTMQGGTYNWSAMPLAPNASSIADEQRKAIGKLTSDIGISVHMSYCFDGSLSGAFSAMAAFAFTNTWGYAQSQYWDSYGDAVGKKGDSELGYVSADVFENAILPNLDAGFPCLLGISGAGGHAIVADGYGYLDGQRYVHMNMGWSGACDYWYTFPINSKYTFSFLTDIVYNLFPTNTGNIVSGRIATPDGTALAGVTVCAYDAASNVVATSTTSATGIYALIVPDKPMSLAIAASRPWYRAASNAVETAESISLCIDESWTEENPAEDTYYYIDGAVSPVIGNRWGVDFTLEPRPQFLIRIR